MRRHPGRNPYLARLRLSRLSLLSRKNYAALSQTLCATGVLILYAETFSCRSYYKFEFFGPVPTFLMMVLITVTAFLLAVRLNALVVAILGTLGGFLTPMLLTTGQDNLPGLFGYIAILDTGLILVALHRRWFFLAALAAIGTAIMQIGLAGKFFVSGKYFEGDKILLPLGMLLAFNGLYLAARWWAKTRKPADGEGPMRVEKTALDIKIWIFGSTIGLAAVALAFTLWFLNFQSLAQRPWLLFGFVLLIDLVALALVLADKTMAVVQPIAGLLIFGLLGFWTQQWLTNELLNAALAFYFIFAVLHSALPAFLQRRRDGTVQAGAIHIFPLLALVLCQFGDGVPRLSQMHIGGRAIGHVRDFAVEADQKAHAAGHAFASHPHSVSVGDFAIRVGQQREIEGVF